MIHEVTLLGEVLKLLLEIINCLMGFYFVVQTQSLLNRWNKVAEVSIAVIMIGKFTQRDLQSPGVDFYIFYYLPFCLQTSKHNICNHNTKQVRQKVCKTIWRKTKVIKTIIWLSS